MVNNEKEVQNRASS